MQYDYAPIGRHFLTVSYTNSRGAVLITALMFMTAMAALGPVLIQTTTVETAMSGNYLKATQAMYAAEAGVNRLIRKYRNDPSLFTETKSVADMALPQAKPTVANLSHQMAYWYTNLTYEASMPPRYVEFESNGTTLGSTSLARISSRILYDPPSPFDSALFAENNMVLNGQGNIDSYNACEAPYDPNHPGDNGDIGTNATGSGSIVLNGMLSLVRGDAAVGVGGEPSHDIGGNGMITGTRTALSQHKQLTPKKAPTGGTFTHISLAGHQEDTLTTGLYEVPYLKIAAFATLHITGDVTVYVNGDLNVTGLGQIVVYTGASLSLYLAEKAHIAGNGIVNHNQLPSTLILYGTESAEDIKIAGNGDFYGVVYAPTADVKIAGLGDLYGAAVGKTVTTSGNGAVHYDECLGKGSNSSGDPFRVVFWRLD
jgi:hypothetical protein